METPSFETTTQVFVGNHSMNIHIMSRLVSICQVLSEEKIKSKSSDNGCQVRAICHTIFIFFIQSCHTPRCPSIWGGGVPPQPEKESFSCVIQIRYTTLMKVVTVIGGIGSHEGDYGM